MHLLKKHQRLWRSYEVIWNKSYSTYYDGTNSDKFIDDWILFFCLSRFRSITSRNEGSEWLICIGTLYRWNFIASIVDIRIKKNLVVYEFLSYRNMCYWVDIGIEKLSSVYYPICIGLSRYTWYKFIKHEFIIYRVAN